jgi:hypothetical protein
MLGRNQCGGMPSSVPTRGGAGIYRLCAVVCAARARSPFGGGSGHRLRGRRAAGSSAGGLECPRLGSSRPCASQPVSLQWYPLVCRGSAYQGAARTPAGAALGRRRYPRNGMASCLQPSAPTCLRRHGAHDRGQPMVLAVDRGSGPFWPRRHAGQLFVFRRPYRYGAEPMLFFARRDVAVRPSTSTRHWRGPDGRLGA